MKLRGPLINQPSLNIFVISPSSLEARIDRERPKRSPSPLGPACTARMAPAQADTPAVFSFLYLKKIKFQKYMSVLKYFKNIPRSPSHRATGPKCNFFFQICNEVPGEKKNKPCRPLGGRQGPVARPTGDRRWARPTGAAGGLSPPLRGRPGCPPCKSPSPPLLSSFEPENSTKNPEKKRGVRRRKAAKPCRIQHL